MSKKKRTGKEWKLEINNNNKNQQNQEGIYTNKTKFNFFFGGIEFYFIFKKKSIYIKTWILLF